MVRCRSPDAVLWPENAIDVDPFHDAGVRGQIESLSAALKAPILVGGIFDGPTLDTAYNAGVVWDATGPGERYVKRKVVPYGEYVPFRGALGGIVPRFDRDIPRDMVPGKEEGALRIGDFTVGDTICWDIAYDGIVRETVQSGAQMLVVQTSNASFTNTSQPAQQWNISRLRAIETGRWVLVPSTNGISGIADASGHAVARARLHEPATLSAKVPLAEGLHAGSSHRRVARAAPRCARRGWAGGSARAGRRRPTDARARGGADVQRGGEPRPRPHAPACEPA